MRQCINFSPNSLGVRVGLEAGKKQWVFLESMIMEVRNAQNHERSWATPPGWAHQSLMSELHVDSQIERLTTPQIWFMANEVAADMEVVWSPSTGIKLSPETLKDQILCWKLPGPSIEALLTSNVGLRLRCWPRLMTKLIQWLELVTCWNPTMRQQMSSLVQHWWSIKNQWPNWYHNLETVQDQGWTILLRVQNPLASCHVDVVKNMPFWAKIWNLEFSSAHEGHKFVSSHRSSRTVLVVRNSFVLVKNSYDLIGTVTDPLLGGSPTILSKHGCELNLLTVPCNLYYLLWDSCLMDNG